MRPSSDEARDAWLDEWSWRLLRWTLAVPLVFHGLWNVSAVGEAWWVASSGLPPLLRWVVGPAELAAALAFAIGVQVRLAAALLVPVMLGAVQQHLAQGYSFKHGGWETPLAYAMLAAALALRPPRR